MWVNQLEDGRLYSCSLDKTIKVTKSAVFYRCILVRFRSLSLYLLVDFSSLVHFLSALFCL